MLTANAALVAIVGDLAVLLLVTAFAVIAALKGKPFLVLAGLVLTPVLWVVGTARLAKPNSYWARRFYTDAKIERAERRFPEADRRRDYSAMSGVIVSAAFVLFLTVIALRAFL